MNWILLLLAATPLEASCMAARYCSLERAKVRIESCDQSPDLASGLETFWLSSDDHSPPSGGETEESLLRCLANANQRNRLAPTIASRLVLYFPDTVWVIDIGDLKGCVWGDWKPEYRRKCIRQVLRHLGGP